MHDSNQLINLVSETKFVHILGAGLNSEKPANSAVKDLSERGWNPIPIHPKDAGASISGYPIRPMIEDGIGPEIVVLFLAPKRAREAIRKLLIRNYESPPLIWFQLGQKMIYRKIGFKMLDGSSSRMTALLDSCKDTI